MSGRKVNHATIGSGWRRTAAAVCCRRRRQQGQSLRRATFLCFATDSRSHLLDIVSDGLHKVGQVGACGQGERTGAAKIKMITDDASRAEVAAGREQCGLGGDSFLKPTNHDVAQVSDVERSVRVGRRVLNDHLRRRREAHRFSCRLPPHILFPSGTLGLGTDALARRKEKRAAPAEKSDESAAAATVASLLTQSRGPLVNPSLPPPPLPSPSAAGAARASVQAATRPAKPQREGGGSRARRPATEAERSNGRQRWQGAQEQKRAQGRRRAPGCPS